MHRRLYAQLAPLILLPLLAGGCVQMTRHSNALVFGTNTSLALKVGTNPTSVPEITVGYSRQEAVIVPLIANTSSVPPGQDNLNRLEPCDPRTAIAGSGGDKFLIHPCSLVAVNGSAMDSYSVLASFGADFGAKTGGTDANASGGLAQYFATGMAAQLLAQNGGASVVAVGGAAAKAAENRPNAAATKALFSSPDAFERGKALALDYDSFQADLISFIKNSKIPETEIPKQMGLLESDANDPQGLPVACATKDSCVSFIRINDIFSGRFDKQKDKLTSALNARKAANGL